MSCLLIGGGLGWGTNGGRSVHEVGTVTRPAHFVPLLLFYLQCPFHAWSLRFVAGLGAGEASSLAMGVSVFALAFKATLPTTLCFAVCEKQPLNTCVYGRMRA